ncbi:phospho-N-acetylmuramoyl-pentapeptide-transferase [Lachnospiraceae bacterium KM106-2]|nr:phospho-N-acetylmuramoyl-pentapeptide-transferase [Lachnospiraceae bacterium KM106-2]
MIQYFNNGIDAGLLAFAGLLLAFLTTCFFLSHFADKLPHDLGRDYAFNGKLSAGKPRGAGFIFILIFTAAALLFGKLGREMIIYLILVVAAMLTGFLDDCSRSPWGEYKKGFLDLVIAIMTGITFLNFNSNVVTIATLHTSITLDPVIFVILAVILVWVSINVTNCSDGVDGLSGTLTIVTLLTIYIIDQIKGRDKDFNYLILLFVICILGYLWYNATPSKMMMGDAGSRAMGLFIAIAVLKTMSPFLYIPVALVLILDGGLGLVKVSLLRFLKIKILANVRTPLHDQTRKVWDWSNTQTVFRFAIIQIMIGMAVVYLIQ